MKYCKMNFSFFSLIFFIHQNRANLFYFYWIIDTRCYWNKLTIEDEHFSPFRLKWIETNNKVYQIYETIKIINTIVCCWMDHCALNYLCFFSFDQKNNNRIFRLNFVFVETKKKQAQFGKKQRRSNCCCVSTLFYSFPIVYAKWFMTNQNKILFFFQFYFFFCLVFHSFCFPFGDASNR